MKLLRVTVGGFIGLAVFWLLKILAWIGLSALSSDLTHSTPNEATYLPFLVLGAVVTIVAGMIAGLIGGRLAAILTAALDAFPTLLVTLLVSPRLAGDLLAVMLIPALYSSIIGMAIGSLIGISEVSYAASIAAVFLFNILFCGLGSATIGVIRHKPISTSGYPRGHIAPSDTATAQYSDSNPPLCRYCGRATTLLPNLGYYCNNCQKYA